jgi:hypothetical protein
MRDHLHRGRPRTLPGLDLAPHERGPDGVLGREPQSVLLVDGDPVEATQRRDQAPLVHLGGRAEEW